MDAVFPRLYLYLLSSQVALLNGCLPQGEALIKAAITLLRDVPATEGTLQCTTRCLHMRARARTHT
jgi:NADH:ubiquinone oxidoreductase subunit B-like Fe-S oxidoreductase